MNAIVTDDDFNELYKKPVEKKYPNITLNRIGTTTTIDELNKLVAANEIPDILLANSRSYNLVADIKFPVDLNPLIKQNKYDLNQFDKSIMGTLGSLGDSGQLVGIPVSQVMFGMYYNKDIFDKFGVAYPKDGMTWDETIELAKKLTRQEDGVQYKGLSAGLSGTGIRDFASTLALPYVNPSTLKAVVNTDGWKKAFTYFKQINDIPGNLGGDGMNFFSKDKILAMFTANTIKITELEALYQKGDRLNWDLAQFPYFQEMPNKAQELDIRLLSISSQSNYKNEAFQAITTIAGKENQTEFVKSASASARTDLIRNEALFGSGYASMKGKHVHALFLSTPVVPPQRTKYLEMSVQVVNNAFLKQVLPGTTDINTTLREAEEAINLQISAAEH
jgi:multiple sugar transport system substrate-binding protein